MRTFLTRELQAEDEQGKKTLRKLPPAELQGKRCIASDDDLMI